MPKPFNRPFDKLRERLLRAGIAPRHIRRYLTELTDHLADLRAEEELTGRTPREAEAAALQRLGTLDDLATAMTTQPRLQSWSARAPWAVFSIAPILALLAAYFVACFYLWSLWQIFMPGFETPFGHPNPGPIYGLINILFQSGKFFYIGAPLLVGWSVASIAARQRVKAIWPIVGTFVVSLMDVTAHVRASLKSIPGGHIRMSFTVGPSTPELYSELVATLMFAAVMMLPYLLWRFRNTLTHSA